VWVQGQQLSAGSLLQSAVVYPGQIFVMVVKIALVVTEVASELLVEAEQVDIQQGWQNSTELVFELRWTLVYW